MSAGGRRFDAVLFDLDGTLVDSLDDIANAAHAVRTAIGLTALTDARIRSFIGDGARRLVARTLADDFAGTVADGLLEDGYRHFQEAYRRDLTRYTRPYPGVIDCLAALRARGVRLGVVTNKPIDFTWPILHALDLQRWFEVVVGGDSATQAKPHAAPVLQALHALKVPPERALMVGDGRNDLLAAAAAGCASVLVRYGYDLAGAEATGIRPLLSTDSLVALPALIENPEHD